MVIADVSSLYHTIPYQNLAFYTIYYILYTIYYILYTIYYILYTIYYILYTIYYILYTIYYILYTIYYILYTIYYILYTIYYILYTFLLYTIYFILYTLYYILYTIDYIPYHARLSSLTATAASVPLKIYRRRHRRRVGQERGRVLPAKASKTPSSRNTTLNDNTKVTTGFEIARGRRPRTIQKKSKRHKKFHLSTFRDVQLFRTFRR